MLLNSYEKAEIQCICRIFLASIRLRLIELLSMSFVLALDCTLEKTIKTCSKSVMIEITLLNLTHLLKRFIK